MISVIILSWNRKEDIRETLQELRQQSYDSIEIIVVDNHSSDGTAAMIHHSFPEVVVIELEENIGIEACNIALTRCKGEYITIFDDDSFPDRGSFTKMIEIFESDDKIAIVAFTIRHYAEFIKKERTGNSAKTANSKNSSYSFDYVMGFSGAGAGFRRSVLGEVGFYSGELFLYMNEMDLSFRVLDQGYSIVSDPDLIAYHKFSPSNRTSWRAPYYYTRNTIWLMWKFYPVKALFPGLVKIAYLVFLHTIEQRTSVYLRATLSSLVHFGKVIDRRKPVQKEVSQGLRMPLALSFTHYR